MEVFLAAYMSKDKKMIEAIDKTYDMHSYSASLIFKEKWSEAEGSRDPIGKPISADGNKLRKISKAASFSFKNCLNNVYL